MIGSELDYRHEVSTAENPSPVRPGVALSSLDALLLARGVSRELPRYKRAADGSVVRAASTVANPNGVSIWREGAGCPFEAAGAYRYSNGVAEVLRRDYFTHAARSQDRSRSGLHAAVLPSRRADGSRSARRLAAVRGDESIQGVRRSRVSARHAETHRQCEPLVRHHGAAHEGVRSIPDIAAVGDRYVTELRTIDAAGRTLDRAGAPTLIGECGIPFDLENGAAYAAWARGERGREVWSKQIVAQSLMYDALDRLLLSSTQWNYTASNRNDLQMRRRLEPGRPVDLLQRPGWRARGRGLFAPVRAPHRRGAGEHVVRCRFGRVHAGLRCRGRHRRADRDLRACASVSAGLPGRRLCRHCRTPGRWRCAWRSVA